MRSKPIFPVVFCFVLVLCFSGVGRAQTIYGYSVIVWDDDAPQRLSGLAGTEIDAYTALYYDAWVHSCLWRPSTEQCMSEGDLYGNPYIDGYHPTFYAISNETYCVDSLHGFADFWYNYYYFSTGVCHTFPVPPDPSPTPTPTCEPGLFGNSPTPCQDPTPLPSPSASIEPIQVVEKYGTAEIRVSTFNNLGGTTKFTIKNPTIGTGQARFAANDSTEIVVPDNVENQALTVKGVTESSQVDNIRIEATMNNRPAVRASDDFTVAVITSLEFQNLNTDDIPLDINPGTGGGQRVFPDKKDPSDATDRSILGVKATVSPAVPNLKVYLVSFDLDDPSANVVPIDANASDGNDNNGSVAVPGSRSSKSGALLNPKGGSCSRGNVNGSPPLDRIECTTSANTAFASFKTTMQPGDNFAVAASLNGDYRNGLRLNPFDGSQIINAGGNAVSISGQTNSGNVAGIRTDTLTVWRKLHLEVDSMGDQGTQNREQGTVTTLATTPCSSPGGTCAVLVVNTTLEEHRFDRGRIQIGINSFDVSANGFNQFVSSEIIILDGMPSGVNNISPGDPFTIYDDDDYNDDDIGSLDGDRNEPLIEPDTSNLSVIHSTDVPCSNTVVDNCSVFAPAYIRPVYDLTGSHERTLFILNLSMSTDIINGTTNPADVQAAFDFDNSAASDRDDFWAVYISSAYQIDERWDGDGVDVAAVGGITDSLQGTGQGCLIFLEILRSTESSHWNQGPINRNYTMAHELGHKFGGIHQDGGLMAQSVTNTAPPGLPPVFVYRTDGVFSPITLFRMRGGLIDGSKLTHP